MIVQTGSRSEAAQALTEWPEARILAFLQDPEYRLGKRGLDELAEHMFYLLTPVQWTEVEKHWTTQALKIQIRKWKAIHGHP